MIERYSIAEARDNFAKLVHAAEAGKQVEVTRRGKPVAVLVSRGEYERLASARPSFTEALDAFLHDTPPEERAGLHEALEGLRDPSPGRRVIL